MVWPSSETEETRDHVLCKNLNTATLKEARELKKHMAMKGFERFQIGGLAATDGPSIRMILAKMNREIQLTLF